MKINRLIIILATITSLVGCRKEVDPINPYIRNYGEESLAVNVDKLEYPGRGGSLSFTVESTYDVELVAPEWITLASSEVPGDGRSYIMTATASMNNAEGGSDREGTILVKTRSLERTVTVTQPFYERPDIPESIASAEDLVYFLEKCASALEEGESLAFSADIDMEGKTFTPVGEFKGILQGNGFRIKNLHSRSPLILRNRGLISGLRIDSSCSFEIPSEEAEQYFGSFVAQNYGTIDGCENDADFIVSESRGTKLYLGGIAGYLYADGTITSCINKGSILYHPQSASANAYLGGITGYSYGAIKDSENYGPITCTPAANTGAYFIGGISPRQEGAGLTGCINHKEAVISTGTEGAKSYIGGIVGYVEGAPATGNNQSYGDLNILLGKESYIGGLQGWQAKVTSGDANVFEGSIVNCNISAQTKASGQYGNNPCKSAGLVTGRFSGQSGYSTLHYGTADKPIRVSGSVTCLATGIKQIATPKDYQLIGSVPGEGDEVFEVEWSADSDTIAFTRDENGMVNVDVNEDNNKEVAYVLTATVKDAAGNEKSVSFDRVVPASIKLDILSEEEIVEIAYTLEDGDKLPAPTALTGKVTSIPSAWSDQYQNITVNLDVAGKTIQCYRLKGEGADKLAEGDVPAASSSPPKKCSPPAWPCMPGALWRRALP